MRFACFSSTWHRCLLNDCVIFLDEQRKPIKEIDRKKIKGQYPYYGASGIIDNINSYIFDDNLILLSEDGANILDRNYRVSFIVRGKLWVNNHAHVLKPKNKIDINYLSEYLENLDYAKYNTGSAQPKLNQDVCKNIIINIPDYDEQQKIGEFLSIINQRIDTQSKIINIFKTLKKIISDQIFNKKDDKIRYEKLKNFAILKNGYAFKSDEYVNNGLYKIITISNVQGSRYIDISDCNTIDKLPNDLKSHQLLKLNDILISLTGNVGRVSLCNKQNCLLNQRVGLIEVIDKEMNEYLYQCLSNYYFEKTMISNGQGAAQLNISKNDVENFEIPINLDKRIVKLLEILDNKILLEQFFLEKLKEQKKYLLSNMFI